MSDDLPEFARNEGAALKKRRRRHRKRKAVFQPVAFSSPENPALITPQMVVAAADEDDDRGPLEVGKAKGGSIVLELPARFLEILTWAARARRETVEQCAVNILRGTLSGMKPAYREAISGRPGGTVKKEALGRMIAEPGE